MRNFAAFLIIITMKRIILLAFTAFSMSIMAQHVTPLSIQFTEIRLDSLRTLYLSEPTMYRAALEVASQQLNKTSEAIKSAKTELKTEQAHAKEIGKSIKEAEQMVKALKKLYSKEEGELKSMQKVVEKQRKTLTKQKELNQEAKDSYTKLLEQQQKELAYCLRDVVDRQKAVADLEATIQNGKNALQTYNSEIAMKTNDLSLIEAKHKQQADAVKAEQKAAKNMK